MEKEKFCVGCLVAPLALAGVGGAAASSGSKKKKKERQMSKIILWISVGLVGLSLLCFIIWYIWFRNCLTCKLN